ncbi:MAG: hypothetical protein CVT79_05610 [Alphaproteobacteria bacterium HGW-Alphaproteobacteria-18]|nr:MAG: hypothetical protein CVT79_05610 [Alphaproteobacteria bacterium HGW-Alphaproteobacteria-18]
MSDATVILTDKRPEPPKADFAFYIDFQKGVGSPSRVFSATSDFIKACERLDKELVRSVDSNIETVLILEDIEAASLKTWLRNVLVATEDDGLKALDWKPLVGKYLVRAKYAILKWIDNEEGPKDLRSLGREIQLIASETDVRHLPDYSPPSPQTLIRAIEDFQGVKDRLAEGDHAAFISEDAEHSINISIRLSIEDIEQLAVKEIVQQQRQPLILAVKKPDYLGESMWEMRFGKRTISAKLADEDWLKRFQNREVDVRPGDSLRCEVDIDLLYGHDNEPIGERYTIVRVIEVLPNTFSQGSLF